MNPVMFCPYCLLKDTLSIVHLHKKFLQKEMLYCDECGNSYVPNATLVSEEAVRILLQSNKEKYQHLMEELNEMVK